MSIDVPGPQTHNYLHSQEELASRVEQKLAAIYSPEEMETLAPIIKLGVEAHNGHDGLDGRPLALHCVDVALSPMLTTFEERELALLHDAATPVYSNFSHEDFIEKARQAEVSEKVIAAALCFDRPTEGWEYDDWISFLMRHDLTRKVKFADSGAAIENFPPQSQNQMSAWMRTRARLENKEPESPEVTARIQASQAITPLPDLGALHQPEVA